MRILSVATALLATVLVVVPGTRGSAQEVPIPSLLPEPSPSPSPEPSPSPTSTSSPRPRPRPSPRPTDDARPAPQASPRPLDPEVARGLAIWRARERSQARTTTRLLELLERAQQDGLSADERRRGFGRFPVAGYVWYQDDWLAPRFVPDFHLHEGTDLFAVAGTPVIASADGVVSRVADGAFSGTAVWLAGDDGYTYYYGHLQRRAPGVGVGARLRVGQLLGWVGASGNARGTYPHVHFEVMPGGLYSINAKPIVDRWLDEAEAAALDAIRALREQALLARFTSGRWDLIIGDLNEPYAPPPAWWAAGAGLGSVVALADAALARMVVGSAGSVATASAEDRGRSDLVAALVASAGLAAPLGASRFSPSGE